MNLCLKTRKKGINTPSVVVFFFFFWLCWVFTVAGLFPLVAVSGDHSLVVLHGFLIVVASLVSEHRL